MQLMYTSYEAVTWTGMASSSDVRCTTPHSSDAITPATAATVACAAVTIIIPAPAAAPMPAAAVIPDPAAITATHRDG